MNLMVTISSSFTAATAAAECWSSTGWLSLASALDAVHAPSS